MSVMSSSLEAPLSLERIELGAEGAEAGGEQSEEPPLVVVTASLMTSPGWVLYPPSLQALL